jgi:fibro-slime domain-containing protein
MLAAPVIRRAMRRGLILAAFLSPLGCKAADVATHDDASSMKPSEGGVGSGGPGATNPGSMVDDTPSVPAVGFILTEVGGYKLGAPLDPSDTMGTTPATSPGACNTIIGIVRDFKGALAAAGGAAQPGGHPDFEVFEGRGITRGLVAPDLGADSKPVYASHCETGVPISATCPFGAMTTSKADFDEWYHSSPGVNKPFLAYFEIGAPVHGVATLWSTRFFPVDGAGWQNSGVDRDGTTSRNFSFTTEIHTTFRYRGGETFTFTGDDDVWIFINRKLAVDLGGLHYAAAGVVDLDQSAAALGIEKGSIYALDLFHAERHSVDSDFRIDLNFAFDSCGYIVP